MNNDQRENARLVHKDFFDRCQFAIDNKFYLEAIQLEYAAMEARMKVVMSLFELPCSLCTNSSITQRIGLRNKVMCFREIIENNPSLFENSKFTRAKASRLLEFCESRNYRIHELLTDTERYHDFVRKDGKLARQGIELSKLLYNETSRLKRMKKAHPERFAEIIASCGRGYISACGDAKESLAVK